MLWQKSHHNIYVALKKKYTGGDIRTCMLQCIHMYAKLYKCITHQEKNPEKGPNIREAIVTRLSKTTYFVKLG